MISEIRLVIHDSYNLVLAGFMRHDVFEPFAEPFQRFFAFLVEERIRAIHLRP